MLRICQPRSAKSGCSRLSAIALLSVAAFGCADVADDEPTGATVKASGGKTVISVPGFPDITLTPDKSSKDGGVIVSVPGLPDFAAPGDSVIEAPGGIKIATRGVD